uniref:Rab-GAP TBC domain-containing protein n=1 Tax=Heterorhabditis bacteriophora TaxID=37862 RepID=A0A1I7XIQ5_HETBA
MPGLVKPVPTVPSVDDLCSIFDDVMSVTSLLDAPNDTFYSNVTEDVGEDTTNDDLMRIKCMTDSKYMYRSVVVARSEFGSEGGSNYGGSVISNRSNLCDLRKLINKAMEPQGLWDLSQNDPSTAELGKKVLNNEMTDSGLSRSTVSKLRTPSMHFNECECSSQMSLEWFDDELRMRDINAETQLPNDRLYCDVEQKQLEVGVAVSSIYYLPNSHDLMAFACEKFQPFSSQFAAIQKLYHRQRLKRIGYMKNKEEGNLGLFLCSALYHRCTLIMDETWEALEKWIPTIWAHFLACAVLIISKRFHNKAIVEFFARIH